MHRGGVFLAVVSLVLLLTASVRAQGPAEYMAAALVDALTKMKSIQRRTGVAFTRNHFGLLGGLFRRRQTMTQQIRLSRGVTYIFVAGGDPDVRDIDVWVSNMDGNLACRGCRDTGVDSAPVVVFRPQATRMYRVTLRLYNLRRGGALTVSCLF